MEFFTALSVLAAICVSGGVGFYLNKHLNAKRIGDATELATRIVEESRKEAQAQKKEILLSLIHIFVLVALMESYTGWDTAAQRLWFDSATHEWVVSNELHARLTWFFYDGPKILLEMCIRDRHLETHT